ncbi:sugar isomerase [Escherichia coli]
MSYARKLHPCCRRTGTWTEEEIRHQPRAWIRSLTNIDALRSALNNFLEPLLRKENLRDHPGPEPERRHLSVTSSRRGSPAIPVKTSAPYRPPIWSPIRWTT